MHGGGDSTVYTGLSNESTGLVFYLKNIIIKPYPLCMMCMGQQEPLFPIIINKAQELYEVEKFQFLHTFRVL